MLCKSVGGSAKTDFGRILRNNIFRHVESFSLHEFDKIGTATLITRTTNRHVKELHWKNVQVSIHSKYGQHIKVS